MSTEKNSLLAQFPLTITARTSKSFSISLKMTGLIGLCEELFKSDI